MPPRKKPTRAGRPKRSATTTSRRTVASPRSSRGPRPAATPLADTLRSLAAAAAATKTPWYVFGAQAVAAYGIERMTADLDVTVALVGTTSAFVRALAHHGIVLRDRLPDAEAFIAASRVLPMVHHAARFPIDVVLAGPGLEQAFLARAVSRSIVGVQVPLVAIEDLLVLKILAGRPKDLADVSALLTHVATIDLDLVRATLREIEAALDQADLLPVLERLLVEVTHQTRPRR